MNNKHGNRAASKSVASLILAPSLLFLFRAQILNYIYTIEVVSTVKLNSLAHSVLGNGQGTWVLCLVISLHFYTDLEPLGVNIWGRAGLELVYEETLGLQASVNLISIPCLTSQIRNSPSSFLSAATDLWGSLVVPGDVSPPDP